jgi:hypothetical protein
MHRRLLVTGLGIGLFALGACRLAPVYMVTDGNFQGSAPLTRRGDQIRRAAIRLGWQIQDVRPGLMRATFSARRDQAVVEIAYGRDQFSIRHAESTNLAFDGTQINRAYNGWVQDLERGIVAASAT